MIKNKKIYEQVADLIEDRIFQSIYQAGFKLPPERALAEELGVSRPSVRDAISMLAARGMIDSRHGDGHYVSQQVQQDFMVGWQNLLNRHNYLETDILDFRRHLEATLAGMAAERRTDADLKRMQYWLAQIDAAHEAGDVAKRSESDVGFHQSIAEASHNILFAQFSNSLLRVLHTHTKTNLGNMFAVADIKQELSTQHHDIYLAIKRKQPSKARQMAQRHIDFIEVSLQAYRDLQQRESISQAIADNEQQHRKHG
ncbi:FadR/GntR family transcriptional regulator [Neisseriaceae bacterium CLB008]|nr:FadR family transcriptional regulator [Neisseriaceae bacterium]